MSNKKQTRLRRATKGRLKIREIGYPRLSVHRTSQHIYAQLFTKDGSQVITSASTLDEEFRKSSEKSSNVIAAQKIGKLIAERAKAKNITTVAFDRSGFKYHGRVKALAEAAREHGLKF